MKEIIGITAALLVFVAYIPYFRDILRGKTKPHPYSWFVWGLTTSFILALQVTHEAGAGAYTTVTVVGISFLVCLLGIKYGSKDITRSDNLFLAAALASFSVWVFAKQPTLSMILLVTTDMLGMAPTIRKSWHRPYEETLSLWMLNSFRHGLSIAALQKITLLTILNPLVWAISNALFSLLLIFRRKSLNVKH